MQYEGSCHCGNIAFEVEGSSPAPLIAIVRYADGAEGCSPSFPATSSP
jgi:hypothetical protein